MLTTTAVMLTIIHNMKSSYNNMVCAPDVQQTPQCLYINLSPDLCFSSNSTLTSARSSVFRCFILPRSIPWSSSSNTTCHARTVPSDSSEAKLGSGKGHGDWKAALYCLTPILIAPRVELYGVKLADCLIPYAS